MKNSSGARSTAICAATALVLALAGAPKPAAAEEYDMDCAVILCLAGGFPSGCAAPHAYMMSRLTARPPKPPFGYCGMVSLEGSAGEYSNYRLARGREPYYCDAGYTLSVQRNDGDEYATCSRRTSCRRFGDSEEQCSYDTKAAYERSEPNWIRITLEPGTTSEFVSERFWY